MSPVPGGPRLFRGYGPLIGFAMLLIAMAVAVPTQKKEIVTEPLTADQLSELSQGATSPDGGLAEGKDADAEVLGATQKTPAASSRSSADIGSGGKDSASGSASTDEVIAPAKETEGGGGVAQSNGSGGGSGAAKVTSCGERQVASDPYSPPCYQFAGGNGGATAKGVTKNTIRVSVRTQAFANGMVDAISKAAGAKIPAENEADIRRTVDGLVDFFNQAYQFYGRKIEVTQFSGKGDVLKETLGGGQEGAQADALTVAEEFQAFADISGVSASYADALARRQVISTGAPYLSRDWLTSRQPYVWSQFTDCSSVVENVAGYYVARMAGKPANLAAGDLADQKRRAAIIAPENSWYQECVDAGVALLNKSGAGKDLVVREAYRLDINQMTRQAATLIPKLKSQKVTTVICGCDPLLLTVLTAKAREQKYSPEWVITGVALVDQDIVGQLFVEDQWKRAIGISFAGPTQQRGQSFGYAAYKAVRNDEPSYSVDLIYNQLALVAIGIQMAGPNLTPATFAQGMYNYPARSGPFGTWSFAPGDYTTSNDAREVYWNPAGSSPATRTKGAYIDKAPGKRFKIGTWPTGQPSIPGL